MRRLAAALVLAALGLGGARAEAQGPPPLVPPALLAAPEAPWPAEVPPESGPVTVTLHIQIDETGRVSDAQVLESPEPAFAVPARAAAEAATFAPATRNGHPVPVRVRYQVSFVPPAPRSPAADPPATTPPPGPPRAPAPRREVDEELTVRLPRARNAAASIGRPELRSDDARVVAGLAQDPVLAVGTLPGTARAPAGERGVIVWGATPDETRILVDDVPVPVLLHAGGLRSVVPEPLVAALSLDPGAFEAAHGLGTGGLLRVSTRRSGPPGTHGSASLNPLDAQVGMSHAARTWSFIAAYREGFAHESLGAVSGRIARVVPLPRDRDLFLQARHEGRGRTTLWALVSDERVTRRLALPGRVDDTQERSTLRFWRVALAHEADSGRSRVSLWAGQDESDLRTQLGVQETHRAAQAERAGARLAQDFGPPAFRLTVGADAELRRESLRRVGTLGVPPREGDPRVFGLVPNDDVASDTWSAGVYVAGLYTQADLALWGERVRLRPGLRLEPTVITVDPVLPASSQAVPLGASRLATPLSPRLELIGHAATSLSFRLAAGVHQQPPSGADLSAVFGNPSLPFARALHLLAGLDLSPAPGTHLEPLVFARLSDRLALRPAEAFPPVANALVARGQGRTFGVRLALTQKAWRGLAGQLAYTFTHSQRRSGADARWRPFDFEEPHRLEALLVWHARPRVTLSSRLRWSSGLPVTPVIGAAFDAAAARYRPLFGPPGGARLPTFFQWDLHLERRFSWERTELSLFLDVVNVTNHTNVVEQVFNHDFTESGALTGLPFLALAGGKVSL